MAIFGLSFHLYGLLIALGILASAQASSWFARRRGFPENTIWNGLWWVIIPAIIGARLYHVLDRWNDIYSLNPISILYVWNGGLGIIGGLVGGALGLWFYYKKLRFTVHDLRFTTLLDPVFFGLPLGQAVGRLGNFVNQEVYGLPSSLPWAIFIDSEHRVQGFENFSTFHPLFAYEALWCLLGFGIMLFAEKNRELIRSLEKFSRSLSPLKGRPYDSPRFGEAGGNKFTRKFVNFAHISFAGFYLVWYGAGRFFLEFLRIPEFSWRFNGFDMAQVFSVVMIGIGLLLWHTIPRKRRV